MYRLNYCLFIVLVTVLSTFSALSSENEHVRANKKGFNFRQEERVFSSTLNFSNEELSKEKIKFNGKMKAGLVLGIIGSITLHNAISAGVATSVLWSLIYYTSKKQTTDSNSLGLGIFFFSLIIPAIVTAAYAVFNLLLGITLAIIGFSLLSRGHDEVKRVALETSYEKRPALAFVIKL